MAARNEFDQHLLSPKQSIGWALLRYGLLPRFWAKRSRRLPFSSGDWVSQTNLFTKKKNNQHVEGGSRTKNKRLLAYCTCTTSSALSSERLYRDDGDGDDSATLVVSRARLEKESLREID